MGSIYLIRHGQASFAHSNYDQLSDTGIVQATVLGQALKARLPQVDAVYSGSLQRHRDTARHALQALGLTTAVHERSDLNEYDHEDIIARHTPRYASRVVMMAEMAITLEPRKAFQRFFKEAVARWVGGQHDAEYAEAWPAFKQRCLGAVQGIAQELGRSKTALVFTSGGPVTALAQNLLRIDDANAFTLNWTLVNCGITKLIYSDGAMHLSTLNEHAHFEGASSELITYR